MKKTLTSLLGLIITCASYSQAFTGVTAGVSFSKIKGDALADSVSISGKPGLRLGLGIEFQLNDKLYLQAAIEYCGKGYKAKNPDYSNTVTMEYVQIPLSLLIKLPLGEEGKIQFMAGAGGYLGFGMTYKTKLTPLDPGPDDETSINSGNFSDYGLRIIDLGLNTLAGVQIGEKVQITASYQPGLQTIFYSDDFGLVKNSMISLQFGYAW